MVALRVISDTEQAHAVDIQATMVAVRDRIENGDIEGEIDTFPFIFKDGEGLKAVRDQYGITDDEYLRAKDKVDSRVGVNSEGKRQVPGMALIIGKAFSERKLTQAFLCSQQVVRAYDTAKRIVDGDTKPELHAQKREFEFDTTNDEKQTREALAVHKKLSETEASLPAGQVRAISQSEYDQISNAADGAISLFAEAGRPEIGAKFLEVKNSMLDGIKPVASPSQDNAGQRFSPPAAKPKK